jgi:hypothetical protein
MRYVAIYRGRIPRLRFIGTTQIRRPAAFLELRELDIKRAGHHPKDWDELRILLVLSHRHDVLTALLHTPRQAHM